jgi:hypothetical protein
MTLEELAAVRAVIAQDDDHFENAAGEDLDWLLKQLANWPTRIDENKTLNIRFLMVSAAAKMLNFAEAIAAVEDAMLQGGDGVVGDFGWDITKLNRARPLIRALSISRTTGEG